jgi:hypothetical protein
MNFARSMPFLRDPVEHLLVAVQAQVLDVHGVEHLVVVLLRQAHRVERVEQALLRQHARVARIRARA